jgi:hypothetical protein
VAELRDCEVTADSIVAKVGGINLIFHQVLVLMKMERHGDAIDTIQELLGATNSVLTAAAGENSLQIPDAILNEISVLSCESLFILAWVFSAKLARHADALKCLERIATYISNQRMYLADVGGEGAFVETQERKLLFVRASVQAALLPEGTSVEAVLSSDYWGTVAKVLQSKELPIEDRASSEAKLLRKAAGKLLEAGLEAGTCASEAKRSEPVRVCGRARVRPNGRARVRRASVRPSTCAAEHVCGRARVRPSTCAVEHMCGRARAHVWPCMCAVEHMCGRPRVRLSICAVEHVCGRAHVRPRRPQGGFGGSPPDSPRFCPLLPQKRTFFPLSPPPARFYCWGAAERASERRAH